jgi:hypothetical protein
MLSRLRNRLDQLEAQITPPGRVFVFYADVPSPISPAEQLLTFKAKHGVTPRDTLVTVVFQ